MRAKYLYMAEMFAALTPGSTGVNGRSFVYGPPAKRERAKRTPQLLKRRKKAKRAKHAKRINRK